jgi:hypothetical protein
MKKLLVHENKRYLMWDDGTPYFYLADTAWEMLHRCNRDEVSWYMETRRKQGFTAIQTVALGELDGIRTPNSYGRKPLLLKSGTDIYDASMPDTDGPYSYWDHVNYCIEKAYENNLVIALLPTWGDKYPGCGGKGPAIFDTDSAYAYGKWLGERYSEYENIIWVMGGDRSLNTQENKDALNSMVKGMKEKDKNHLFTFHPCGGRNSYDDTGNLDWIDFHMYQTGHSSSSSSAWKKIRKLYNEPTGKPILDGEPCYEDIAAMLRRESGYYFNAADVRLSAWQHVLEGCCGHTYGNGCVWGMTRGKGHISDYRWEDVLFHEGAMTMKYVKDILLSRDYFSRIPCPELIVSEETMNNHYAASCGKDYIIVYTPYGLPISVKLGTLQGKYARSSWYNPRTGEMSIIGVTLNKEVNTFAPFTRGKGNDWVLVIDIIQ